MTAWMMLWPSDNGPGGHSTPCMVADTVATLKFAPEVDASDYVSVRPSNIEMKFSGRDSDVRLVRKLSIVDDVAIAIAGNRCDIEVFLREARMKFMDVKGGEERARWLSDAASKFNEMRIAEARHRRSVEPPQLIEVGAIAPGEEEGPGRRGIYSIAPKPPLFPAPPVVTRHCGICNVAGSGYEEISHLAATVDRAFARNPDDAAVVAGGWFAAHMSARRFGIEVTGSGARHWGGPLEFAGYMGRSGWTRGPSQVHFVLFVGFVREFTGYSSLSTSIQAYDPGVSHGRILALRYEESQITTASFTLANFFDPAPPPRFEIEHWEDFRPDIALVTVVGTYPGEGMWVWSASVPAEAVIWEMRNGAGRVTLDDEWIDRLAGSALANQNIKYLGIARHEGFRIRARPRT